MAKGFGRALAGGHDPVELAGRGSAGIGHVHMRIGAKTGQHIDHLHQPPRRLGHAAHRFAGRPDEQVRVAHRRDPNGMLPGITRLAYDVQAGREHGRGS